MDRDACISSFLMQWLQVFYRICAKQRYHLLVSFFRLFFRTIHLLFRSSEDDFSSIKLFQTLYWAHSLSLALEFIITFIFCIRQKSDLCAAFEKGLRSNEWESFLRIAMSENNVRFMSSLVIGDFFYYCKNSTGNYIAWRCDRSGNFFSNYDAWEKECKSIVHAVHFRRIYCCLLDSEPTELCCIEWRIRRDKRPQSVHEQGFLLMPQNMH